MGTGLRDMAGAMLVAGLIAVSGCGASDTDGPPDAASDQNEVTTTSAAPVDAPGGEFLRPDGLAGLAFGLEAEEAASSLVAELGEPDTDSGWEPATQQMLQARACPDGLHRVLTWNGLGVRFVDGATELGNGPHLYSYQMTMGDLNGPYGLRVGDQLEAARDAVGNYVAEEQTAMGATFWRVQLLGDSMVLTFDQDNLLEKMTAGGECAWN